MSDKIGIRRSQLIMPFGVGAVLDVGNESFVAADISEWRHTNRMRQIKLERLSRFLGRRLLEPPVPLAATVTVEAARGIPCHRRVHLHSPMRMGQFTVWGTANLVRPGDRPCSKSWQ